MIDYRNFQLLVQMLKIKMFPKIHWYDTSIEGKVKIMHIVLLEVLNLLLSLPLPLVQMKLWYLTTCIQ